VGCEKKIKITRGRRTRVAGIIHGDAFVYFCFPTLGVAVPLRPGDYLRFNALIPH
jgi:hypothetical protein